VLGTRTESVLDEGEVLAKFSPWNLWRIARPVIEIVELLELAGRSAAERAVRDKADAELAQAASTPSSDRGTTASIGLRAVIGCPWRRRRKFRAGLREPE